MSHTRRLLSTIVSRQIFRDPSSFAPLLLILLSHCTLYEISETPPVAVEIPNSYSVKSDDAAAKTFLEQPWWLSYNQPELNSLLEQSLSTNFSLRSAWNRLQSAQAIYQNSAADRFPKIDISNYYSRTRTKEKSSNSEDSSNSTENYFSLGGFISYEADLWGRISSLANAELANFEASRAEVEATILVLSGNITDEWISAQEQKALLNLLEKQVKVSRTLVDLTQLRFQVGKGSALDVYQQRQQLSSTISEIPIANSTFEQTINRISVLAGIPPTNSPLLKFEGKLPELPPFPSLISPTSLLETRPDLRAARERLRSAQYQVAAAIADQYPQINLSLSYTFNAKNISDLFDNEIKQMASNLFMPIFDAGSRKAKVDENKAIAAELTNNLTNSFLIAMKDVENAIIAEKYQIDLINELQKQIELANRTLNESRVRYLKGLSDYLQVTLALQALQSLERRIVTEHAKLLRFRNQLYMACGGSWTINFLPKEEEA